MPLKLLALSIASLILMVLSLFVTVQIEFTYRRRQQRDSLSVNLQTLKGLVKFSLEIPEINMNWEKTPALELQQKTQAASDLQIRKKHKLRPRFFNPAVILSYWPRLAIVLQRLKRVKQKFYQGIECTALKWHIEYGAKDSAATAITVGVLWACIGYSLARLHKLVTVKVSQPQIAVIPRFGNESFVCDFYCIFQMRIGHIMLAGLSLLRVLQEGRRGQLYG